MMMMVGSRRDDTNNENDVGDGYIFDDIDDIDDDDDDDKNGNDY
jgi:hypothetical protein